MAQPEASVPSVQSLTLHRVAALIFPPFPWTLSPCNVPQSPGSDLGKLKLRSESQDRKQVLSLVVLLGQLPNLISSLC